MQFSELNLSKQLQKAINELNFTDTTTIQEKSFPVVMSGKDVVGIAQTGTGKTFAFLLPIINNLKFTQQIEPRVLIVAPTRELVQQIVNEARKLTQFTNLRVTGIYGGANINTQKEILLEGVDILVSTPGRVIDLAHNGTLRLKFIQKFVLDEMDEMLELGFRSQITTILDLLPERRQNLLFSATITPQVEEIIDVFFNSPQRVEAAPHGTPVENISQELFEVPNFNTKVNLLNHLFENNSSFEKVIIFTKSKRIADILFEEIEQNFDGKLGIIHSNKSQNQRFNAMKQFQNGETKAIIATDLVSRGLDIADVTHVINFDIPDDAPNYIHRIGRTGRADKKGNAISFVTEKDSSMLAQIESMMNMKIDKKDFPATVEISDVLIELEKPQPIEVNYLKPASIKESKGAFHEKKKKNAKVNLGSMLKRKAEDKLKRKKMKRRK